MIEDAMVEAEVLWELKDGSESVEAFSIPHFQWRLSLLHWMLPMNQSVRDLSMERGERIKIHPS